MLPRWSMTGPSGRPVFADCQRSNPSMALKSSKPSSGHESNAATTRCHVYVCMRHPLLITLKALPHQWVALDTAIVQFMRSRMLTSVSQLFVIYILMVSLYLKFGLPLGLTPSASMSSAVLVIWLSFLRLTCPNQRSRFCIRRVVNCCRCPDLLISYVVSQTNTLYPSQHSHFSLIHQPLVLLFHCPAFSHICHRRLYNTLINNYWLGLTGTFFSQTTPVTYLHLFQASLTYIGICLLIRNELWHFLFTRAGTSP